MTDTDRRQALSAQSNETARPHGASDPQVLQNLDRLDELLSRAGSSSSEGVTAERRQVERRNVMTQIVVVQQAAETSGENDAEFNFVEGQTLNLSTSGVAFVTSRQLNGDSFLALLRHPDYQTTPCCFELTLFRSRQLADGQWEHGAVLRPLVSGPTAFTTALSATKV
ncbi:MAG: hypothetical protein ACYTGL_17775 [Planctomycetota bacterium]|jgi:hypothetical protein